MGYEEIQKNNCIDRCKKFSKIVKHVDDDGTEKKKQDDWKNSENIIISGNSRHGNGVVAIYFLKKREINLLSHYPTNYFVKYYLLCISVPFLFLI